MIRHSPAGCWDRRSRLEKRLIVLLGFIILLCSSLVVVTLVYSTTQDNNICLTKGCVLAAAALIGNIDESIDPCDNFYDFACGGFVKNRIIPDDATEITPFTILNDKVNPQVRILIEKMLHAQNYDSIHKSPFNLVTNLYMSCMNTAHIEELGLKPITSLLQDLGGWPVVEGPAWDPSNFSWTQSVYKLRRIGQTFGIFLDFSVATDSKNSTSRIIYVELAVFLGADHTVAETEMRDALEFEIQLANITLPDEERRNATALYNPMTIRELQSKFPSIPWLEYIMNVLPSKVKVNSDEVIIVSVPSYISSLEILMTRTDKRVQANYLMWSVAARSVFYMNEALRDLETEYNAALIGLKHRKPRWEECVEVVSENLAHAVGALYVRRHFKEEAKKNVEAMVSDVRKAFLQILDEIDWMDTKTKEIARGKAMDIQSHIGYPIELLNDMKLQELYSGLEIGNFNYFENILNLSIFGTDFAFGRLRQVVNKSDWISHGNPTMINAFYSADENSIQFPAGILQGIFFNIDRPQYLNYGSIGWVIGHELTHGFDDEGKDYDKNGNLVDWWEAETKVAYLTRAQCIIDQYSNFSVPELGLKVNGKNTVGENIADNGGIKEAYKAYEAWLSRNGKAETLLPGLLNYNQRQLFWISAANNWCAKYTTEELKSTVLTGSHSPVNARVIGSFSNQESFNHDFNCPSTAKMNPVNKCNVW